MNRSRREAWHDALLRTRQCQQGSIHAVFLQLGCLTRAEVTSTLPKSPCVHRMLSGVGLRRAHVSEEAQHRSLRGVQFPCSGKKAYSTVSN